MKKVLAVILAAILCLSACACVSRIGKPANGPETAPQQTEASKLKDRLAELDLAGMKETAEGEKVTADDMQKFSNSFSIYSEIFGTVINLYKATPDDEEVLALKTEVVEALDEWLEVGGIYLSHPTLQTDKEAHEAYRDAYKIALEKIKEALETEKTVLEGDK